VRYLKPRAQMECAAFVAEGATLLAGGTALVPNLCTRLETEIGLVVDLSDVEELRQLEFGETDIAVGAMVRLTALADAPWAARDHALREAALAVGNPAVRRMGTVGGNVASTAYSADLRPALLALEARLELAQSSSVTEQPLADSLGIPPRVLLCRVLVPRQDARRSTFIKFGWRASSAVTVVAVAAALELVQGVIVRPRFALSGVSKFSARLPAAERAIAGQAPSSALFERVAARAAEELGFELEGGIGEGYRRQLARTGFVRALHRLCAP